MPLQKQNFFLSLAQGVDTKSDPKQVIPGKLLVLENGIFTSPKEIRKRNGYGALSLNIQNNISFDYQATVPATMENGNFLASFNNEVVLNDQFNLYSYSDGLAKWIYKDQNTIDQLSVTSILRNTNSQTLADSAINPNGLQMFAWEDSSGESRLSIIDTQTGQVIIGDKEIVPSGGGDTLKPKCVYINNTLLVFYLDNSSGMELFYITYNNGVFSSPVSVASDVNVTNNNYDVMVFNNKLYLTYNTNAGSIKTTYFTMHLASTVVFTKAGESASNCITIFPDLNGNIWVAYATATNGKRFVFNNTLTVTILAPANFVTKSDIYNITGFGDSDSAFVFYDVLGAADVNGKYSDAQVSLSRIFLVGGPSGELLFLRSAALQSKAFSIISNGVYVPHLVLTHDSALQPTYYLCNYYNSEHTSSLPSANVAAKIAANLGGGVPAKKSSLSSINFSSTNIAQTALLQKDLLYTSTSTSGTVNTYTQTGIISASFDFTKTNLKTKVLGQNLHISSGILDMYDGSSVVEHNFNLYPEDVSIVVNTSGGNLTDSSSYGYQVTYEWTDNQGQLHRSAPSPVVSITTGIHSNQSQAVLTIPTLRITSKSNVIIVVYRTQANGTVYYRLNLPSSPLYNDTTIDTVTYTDNSSDASIAANEQLYTTGGEVPNSAAPGTSILGEYKNRLILIPSDNPYSWWYSKQVIPGSPVEFSDIFVENIGTDGGPITAFLQMDSNAIFFKEKNIFYVVGDGPSPSGANNDFTQALAIASDVGCIDQQSLILMPFGAMFKSHKGIYLLSRGLEVDYIGSDVEAFNSISVTSAQLIVETNQVRFTLASGVILVYDYFVKQWSIFTNLNGISSILVDNNFTYLQSNGLTLEETPGVFNDNGTFIKLKLISSWLSLSGIQGFQRIYKALILGQYFGPHKLLVQLSYDFNPINTQQTYIDATQVLNSNIYGNDPLYGINSPYGGAYPTYQWRIFTERQVCESVQISIEDVQFAGTYTNMQGTEVLSTYNESLSLSAITLELGIKKGANKLPADRSFG